ncbi:hypothetical protein GOP47_0002969 [Adiantum capillus-veneris]|uniref:Uncharacterized protein n=1 Tax=Adiantum capillus-veneris TaxID=13818 RepID=A0A9D4VCM3_ADICA|nr:hypothetical protein GOP47_0002969 [Adiantum capillus-veneris]
MAVAASLLRAPAIATRYRNRHALSFLPKHSIFPALQYRLPSFSFSCFASVASYLSHVELEQIQVLVHGRELAIVQPRDVDNILDMYINQGRLDGDPYWCRIWPSAIALAEEMLKNTRFVANLRVCDLGSGLGLAGVSALLAGARQVVFYDQEPLALFCSLLTVHANVPHATTNLPSLVQQMFPDSSPEYIESLAYGLALSPEIFELRSSHKGMALMARAEVFDWSKKEMDMRSFDTVLASDVLYEKGSLPYIAAILPNLIRSGSGKVIMTDPTYRTPQNREEFLGLLCSEVPDMKGLKLERMDNVKLQSNDKTEDVELMHFCST